MGRVLFVFFVCLLFGEALHGQNPGFKGRHFSVSFENFLSSSLTTPNVNGNEGFTALNNRHGLRLGYTLSKNLSASLNYSFYLTKVELIRQHPNLSGDTSRGLGDLIGHDIGVNLRLSLDELLLPLGDYLQVGGGLYSYELSYDPSNFQYEMDNNEVAYTLPQKETHQFKDWGINIAFGSQRILFDYLFIDYAVQMDLIFAEGFIGRGYCCSDHPGDLRDQEKYLKIVSSNRSQNHHLINLKVGIGYLPF